VGEAFRSSSDGMHPHHNFRLAEPGVFTRREAHVTGKDELTADAPDAATNLSNTHHRRFRETNECIHEDWEAGTPYRGHDISDFPSQIKMRQVEIRNRALEYNHSQGRAVVHTGKQILEALEHGVIYHVERWIVEDDPPVGRRFLDNPHGRRSISLRHLYTLFRLPFMVRASLFMDLLQFTPTILLSRAPNSTKFLGLLGPDGGRASRYRAPAPYACSPRCAQSPQ